MAVIYTQGGAERLQAEIVEATPLHAINSTAYACKIEYRFEDSLHSAVIINFRNDGDPVPTNMEEVKAQSDLGVMDTEPHFSMEWANRKVQTPGKYRNLATEVSIVEKII